MGGTALTMHLRHRSSQDIDIMTFEDFSGSQLASQMERHIEAVYGDGTQFNIRIETAEECGYFARVDGVKFDVFQARKTESVAARDMHWLAPATEVDGVPVGSVPDILASKLDVIMYRPNLRDYIDLASIDRQTTHTLELGIAYYKRKYSYDIYPRPDVIRRIVNLLEAPGQLIHDGHFEDRRDEVLKYLERRAKEVRRHVEGSDDQSGHPLSSDSET